MIGEMDGVYQNCGLIYQFYLPGGNDGDVRSLFSVLRHDMF